MWNIWYWSVHHQSTTSLGRSCSQNVRQQDSKGYLLSRVAVGHCSREAQPTERFYKSVRPRRQVRRYKMLYLWWLRSTIHRKNPPCRSFEDPQEVESETGAHTSSRRETPSSSSSSLYSPYAHWKARSGLPIRINWTFFARCYSSGATSHDRLKIGVFEVGQFRPITVEGDVPHEATNHFCTDGQANECLTTLSLKVFTQINFLPEKYTFRRKTAIFRFWAFQRGLRTTRYAVHLSLSWKHV